jgi:hypothetical protein
MMPLDILSNLAALVLLLVVTVICVAGLILEIRFKDNPELFVGYLFSVVVIIALWVWFFNLPYVVYLLG